MFTDRLTIFSTAQNIANVDATAISTNVVDLGASPTLRSLGFDSCFMQLSVGTAFAGIGTLEIQIVSDSVVGLSSPTVHWSSGALATSAATAGLNLEAVPLALGARYERYLGLRYIAVSEVDAGTIYAHITPSPSIRTIYPDAI